MKVIIVGHHSRQEWIEKLLFALEDDLGVGNVMAIIDDQDRGSLFNHRRALEAAYRIDDRVVIMEDDAIPVVGFGQEAADWLEAYPNDLISFYLGTSRPVQWQHRVDMALADTDGHCITLPNLIHGVCYSVPPHKLSRVIQRLRDGPADEAVGRAWAGQVVYPVESLVEHRDGPPVERHNDGEKRAERRVARNLAGPLMFDR